MIRSTRRFLVPCAFVAAALSLVVLSGCEKAPEEPISKGAKESPASPEVYMKDPVFQKAIKKESAVRKDLAKVRDQLQKRAKEMIAEEIAKGAKDEAAARVALAKNEEWVLVNEKIADAKAAMEDARARMTKIVSERMRGK